MYTHIRICTHLIFIQTLVCALVFLSCGVSGPSTSGPLHPASGLGATAAWRKNDPVGRRCLIGSCVSYYIYNTMCTYCRHSYIIDVCLFSEFIRFSVRFNIGAWICTGLVMALKKPLDRFGIVDVSSLRAFGASVHLKHFNDWEGWAD